MKISSINSISTNFNGLWGKENTVCISQSYYDHAQMVEMGTNHHVVNKTYYPFKNETDGDIKSVVKKNEVSDNFSFDTDSDQSETIIENKVKVMPRLDISADEYEKYKNDDLLSKDENRVEDILKLAGLKQYLLRNIRRR